MPAPWVSRSTRPPTPTTTSATVAAKLDWDSLTTSGMTLQTLTIDRALDIHADGSVAMNALSGVLVASGSFSLDLGQVSTTAPNNGTSFTNASAVSLTLSNATVFVGAGGRLSDATAAANVLDGTLGFRGAVNALKVVSIKDTNNGSVATTDDRSYLGVQASGLSADLIGLDGILDFHASNVNVLVNKAADSDNTIATVPAKLDWDSLVTSGMALQSLAIDRALDIHADGSVALSLLGFVVGSASFSYDTRTVNVDQNANGVFSLAEKDLKDATLLTIGLSNLNLFVGAGASLGANGVPVTTGAIGFSVQSGELGIAIIQANASAIAGDNRSYLATSASIGLAQFVGLPSDISIRAADISVDINRSSGTVPQAAPARAPPALDWTQAIDTDGDGVFADSVTAGSRTIALTSDFTGISGKLGLNAFNVLQVFASFEMTIRTVDVDVNGDGLINPGTGARTDLDDAQLLAIDLQFLQLDRAADLNGDNTVNAADAAIYDALKPASVNGTPVLPGFFVGVPGSVGFKVDSGRLTFATIKANPDATKSVDTTRTYTVILAGVAGAGMVGLPDGVVIEATRLDFLSNDSSLSTTTNKVALDWTTAVDLDASAASFDADDVVIANRTITPTALDAGLSISGAVKLDILGYVLAAGEFSFDQLFGISGSDGAITLANATGQRLTLSNLQFFVGVNGAFAEDTEGNLTGLDTDDAIGFGVSNASLDLIIVKEGGTGTRSWMGITAGIGAMGVYGLPGDFALEILSLALRFNGKAADGSKLDWAALSLLTGDPLGIRSSTLSQITRATNISITGRLYLDVGGFVIALADFSIDQQSGVAVNDTKTVNVPLALPGQPGANVLLVRISGAYLFVGVGGVVNKAGYANSDAFRNGLEAAGAVGFFVSDANLDLAIVSQDPLVGGQKWIGISATDRQPGHCRPARWFHAQDQEPGVLLQPGLGRWPAHGLAGSEHGNTTDGFNLDLGSWPVSTTRPSSRYPAR
jgi:hypothetical protein